MVLGTVAAIWVVRYDKTNQSLLLPVIRIFGQESVKYLHGKCSIICNFVTAVTKTFKDERFL